MFVNFYVIPTKFEVDIDFLLNLTPYVSTARPLVYTTKTIVALIMNLVEHHLLFQLLMYFIKNIIQNMFISQQ